MREAPKVVTIMDTLKKSMEAKVQMKSETQSLHHHGPGRSAARVVSLPADFAHRYRACFSYCASTTMHWGVERAKARKLDFNLSFRESASA
jgi:hypothetical protein